MAPKIGDICDTCGKIIKSYPIYGGTCHVCRYKKYVEETAPVIKSNIDAFLKNVLMIVATPIQ